jgi:phospholipid N-methyltransferase
VAPSGRALASLITREIDRASGKVLELGPGTGIFTDRLVTRGVAQSDLTLVEQNPGFVRLLKQRFPRASVLGIDAAALGLIRPPQGDLFGAAVCGLGLRNMPVGQIEAIMRSAFSQMLPDAAFYLFTYGRRCSVPVEVLERLDLVAEHLGTALLNLPPASVYRIARVRDVR